jgi:hypothetical protein
VNSSGRHRPGSFPSPMSVTPRQSRWVYLVSYDRLPHNRTRPHHQKAHEHAQNDVKQSDCELTVLNRSKCLVLESRERRVSTDEADGNEIDEITVGWTQMGSLAEYGHDQADEKTTGSIDEERTVGKARPHPLSYKGG